MVLKTLATPRSIMTFVRERKIPALLAYRSERRAERITFDQTY